MSNKMFKKIFLEDEDNQLPKIVREGLEFILSKDVSALTSEDMATLRARKEYISEEYIKAYGIGESVVTPESSVKEPSMAEMKDALTKAGVEFKGNASKATIVELFNGLSNTSTYTLKVKELTDLGTVLTGSETEEELDALLATAKAAI